MLKGKGFFSSFDGDFADFLSRTGADPMATGGLTARNYLLDEGVVPGRAATYRSHGAVTIHAGYGSWQGHHRRYLEAEVFGIKSDPVPPDPVDAVDKHNCPETFRLRAAGPFAPTALDVDLVRVLDLKPVAEAIAVPEETLRDQAIAAIGPPSRTEMVDKIEDALAVWTSRIDLRPVFAAFWEDVKDLFGDSPTKDQGGWANTLRDRLGLAHYNPVGRTRGVIDVLVFKYAVRTVPRLGSEKDTRPLVPPTVLDGTHNDAFCPAPLGLAIGHTVDLSANRPLPRREVLHPALALHAKHVFRVGKIDADVDRSLLPIARRLHLDELRRESALPDYAAGTDGDLR